MFIAACIFAILFIVWVRLGMILLGKAYYDTDESYLIVSIARSFWYAWLIVSIAVLICVIAGVPL